MADANNNNNNSMGDEYGAMNSEGETYQEEGAFRLECGKCLQSPVVRYRTWGTLREPSRDNAMVVCHALTGNAALDSWWGDMLGPGKLFDTSKYFVICCNVLGSCYGTTGPNSIDPATGKIYASTFPDVTVRDCVRLHSNCVFKGLGVRRVTCVIGGSLGGMQALEWALLNGEERVGAIIAMCCGAQHLPWQIGISECQRQAIYADPKWRGGDYPLNDPPSAGLSVARQFAMVTYRSDVAYTEKFGRDEIFEEPAGNGQLRYFEVERYLRYQGVKFTSRFDARSYVAVTRLMDTHDVGHERGGVVNALKRLTQPTLVIGVSSDALYPPNMQSSLARMLPNCEYRLIESSSGHDGFLLDQEDVEAICKDFMRRRVEGVGDSRL